MNSNILYDRIISKIENSISSNNLFNLIIDNKFQEILKDINKIRNNLNENFKIDVISHDIIYNNCINENIIIKFQNYEDFINNQIDNFYISLANSYIKNNNNYLYYFLIYKIHKDLESFREKFNGSLLDISDNNKFDIIDERLLNITHNFRDIFDSIREKYDKKIKVLNEDVNNLKKALVISNLKLEEFQYKFNILFYFSLITSMISLIIYIN
jgi:hypothetical protein